MALENGFANPTLSRLAIVSFFVWVFWDSLASIPYGQFLRDPSRWIVLQLFAYATMIALLLHFLFKKRQRTSKLVAMGGAIAVVGTLGILSLPFWDGSLVGRSVEGQIVGIRTWNGSAAHIEVESWLSERSKDSRALFLPVGLHLGSTDDPRFNGPHHEFSDIFGLFGPAAGDTSAGKRLASSLSRDFGIVIEENLGTRTEASASRLLGLANTLHVVVRTDMYGPGLSADDLLLGFRSDSNFRQVFESGPVIVFENLNPLPRLYAATRSIANANGPIGIPNTIEAADYVHGATVILGDDSAIAVRRRFQTLPGNWTRISSTRRSCDFTSTCSADLSTGP